jgi:SAM-dependent methyltransferase
VTDNWFVPAFGAHYPLLYQHRDAAEAIECLDLLPRLAPLTSATNRPILDLGCGDGRHLDVLRERGHEAIGLDLSADLLRSALTRDHKGGHPVLVRGDMRTLPFADDSFASVLSLFTAFGYFGPPSANRDPIREVSRVLTEGGHWFLDYFDGDHVRRELGSGEPAPRQREIGPLVVDEIRSFESDTAQVCKRVHLRPRPGMQEDAARWGVPGEGLEYTERVAVFTLNELDTMAAREGLTRVAQSGGYEGIPLGEGNRWILVYRKNPKDVI